MRRVITTVAVAAMAAAGLAACGSDSGGGENELDLLVPSYSPKTKPYWEELIKDFEAKNSDVKINLEVVGWADIPGVVTKKIQNDQAPDILELDAAGPAYGAEDLLYPAKDIVSAATMKDIVPSFVASSEINGTAWGVPTVASTRALFYNKTLFEQAGIAAPPKTWAELLDAASKIKALNLPDTAGYGMPLGPEESQAETSIFAYGAGGSWEKDGKITVDTPEATEALTFMKQMITDGVTQPNPGSTQRASVIDLFIQGKLGMIQGLPPIVGQIKEKAPDLKWEIAPSPTKDGSASTLGVADYFVGFDNGEDKQGKIASFLDFFYEKDNYVKFNDAEGFIPATKSGAEAAASKPELTTFLNSLPDAKFYPISNPKWGATQGAFQQLVGELETKAPADVLKEIQTKADEDS